MKSEYQSYYKQLGLNIAYYRKLQGLTQLDLAEFTDLSRTHISNIDFRVHEENPRGSAKTAGNRQSSS